MQNLKTGLCVVSTIHSSAFYHNQVTFQAPVRERVIMWLSGDSEHHKQHSELRKHTYFLSFIFTKPIIKTLNSSMYIDYKQIM
jgi:hypothetical protein